MRTPRGPTAAARFSARAKRAAAVGTRSVRTRGFWISGQFRVLGEPEYKYLPPDNRYNGCC